ncbi:DUF5131 family protein [Nostoc sp. CCY 9925]|uniref:DUF5131 family protein n=1 Tax=Nostoc sp. CCY 9925 TaxID=3103865 RepID=UPI0039C661DA
MTTNIQWADETWNVIVGCSKISPACKNCYAATAAKSARLQQFPQYQKVAAWDGTVEFVCSQLLKPLSWKKPKKIFVCSMSDLFHENIPFEWIDKVMAVIALSRQHTLEENQKEEKHIQETPPTQESCVCEETDLEELNQEYEPISESDSEKLNHQEEPIPQSPTSLSTKSESSYQTDQPSCRPTMAGALFDKNEQANNKPSKPKFQSIEDLLNLVLLDSGIMASDPLPAVYRSEIKLRGWHFPWRTATRDKIYQTCDRRLVELIAKERAKWSKCEWQEKIPTVIKSIGNLEATKGGLEELLGYWSKVVESAAPQAEESSKANEPIGYYSNRSLEWHKATFCELLDLGDKVGTDKAIAQFSTRYDQQHTGATNAWLNWLQSNYPQMYAHLYPKAA